MFQPGIRQLPIGAALLNWVFIVAVERGGIYQIDDNLAGTVYDNRIALGLYILSLHLDLGAEMDTARGVIREALLSIVIAG